MKEIIKSKPIYVIWTVISGKLSFFIGGLLGCIILLHLDNYIMETVISGGLGGLLFGICVGNPRIIGKSTIAGLVAVPVGFWSAFILAEAIFSIPFIHDIFNKQVPDIIAIVLMGMICGVIFGAIVFGRKAILMFSAVCGIVSIPYGILISQFNGNYPIKRIFENLTEVFGPIDLNFLLIITSFGTGLGLSIGLFKWFKH